MEVRVKFSTLFIVAHPFLERSRANRAITEAVRDLPGLTLRNLYDLYPYFQIDVGEEQRLLRAHDLIVIQHPFYWYSMPALLKQWLDEVWLGGWAYGPEGNALRGKKFLLSITTGGLQDTYQPEGMIRHSFETLLSPWNQTVHLCGMKWHRPAVMRNAMHAGSEELQRHALDLREALERFSREGELT